MNANPTLLPAAQREARQYEKRTAVLRFLRDELWSTSSILGMVMRVQARQAVHRSLQQLEHAELLRRHTYNVLGRSMTIWGISAHGQACAFDPATEEPISAYFEPSRVSELTLAHALDVQRLRVAAERAGWTQWRNGDRLGVVKDGKRPDALATSTHGVLTAIECERTLKTTKRYEVILAHYLQAIRRGDVARVAWVCPDGNLATRLQRIVTGIRAVPVAGQRIAIEPARHHTALRFVSFAQWPILDQGS
jgi:hypothetical protein